MNKMSSEIAVVKKDDVYRLEGSILYLVNVLKFPQSEVLSLEFFKDMKNYRPKRLSINLDELTDIDSSGVMSLFFVKRGLEKTGIKVELEGGKENILQKIELFHPDKTIRSAEPLKQGFFEKLGAQVHHFIVVYLYEFLLLAADIFYWAVRDIFRPKSRKEGEFTNQAVIIGVNAVLIVVFMSFVIGLVMSLHSSYQLRTFGANIYIVDLIVIAMMSQMGPLITAILVAGRSGSSIAAEIATMKVTSELDALKTMGLNPIRFVVVPKLYASLLTLPFLIVLSNVSGIVGGAVAANVYLDITPEVFINRMGSVMQNKDLWTGFVKSQVYAALIVLTGSFYGFRVTRGAEGVGLVTTTAVVVSISLVILADSVLGLLFY